MKKDQQIHLVLEDGTIFTGNSFGYYDETDGEVVFNTGMTGYTKSLTDPSYHGQILVSTYPLVGNYGIPDEKKEHNKIKTFIESDKIQIRAFIVSENCQEPSHWNKNTSLSTWLKKHKIPGISGIDTRALTKKLREKGVMLGKITTKIPKNINKFNDPNLTNLVNEVSTKEIIKYKPKSKKIKTVLLYDFGIKYNIIRNFIDRGIEIIRLPWNYNIQDIKDKYDGVFFSPGPGDPKIISNTISSNIQYCLKKNIPTFGICLGHQLLALSIGADTYKLKYGHRSVNQPCLDIATNHCYITSQNHGYAVNEKTIPKDWQLWMININDNTCEGIKHKNKPFFSVQFHPEANPGPKDTEYLFDEFVKTL